MVGGDDQGWRLGEVIGRIGDRLKQVGLGAGVGGKDNRVLVILNRPLIVRLEGKGDGGADDPVETPTVDQSADLVDGRQPLDVGVGVETDPTDAFPDEFAARAAQSGRKVLCSQSKSLSTIPKRTSTLFRCSPLKRGNTGTVEWSESHNCSEPFRNSSEQRNSCSLTGRDPFFDIGRDEIGLVAVEILLSDLAIGDRSGKDQGVDDLLEFHVADANPLLA